MTIHLPIVNLGLLTDTGIFHVNNISKLLREQHHIKKKIEVECKAILDGLYSLDEKDGYEPDPDSCISLTIWDNKIMQVIVYGCGTIKLFLANPDWQVCKLLSSCGIRKCVDGNCLSCEIAIDEIIKKCTQIGKKCNICNICNICKFNIRIIKYNCDTQDCSENCPTCYRTYPSNIKQFVTYPDGKIILPFDASKQSEQWLGYDIDNSMRLCMTGGETPNIIDDLLKSDLRDFHEKLYEHNAPIALFPEILYTNVVTLFDKNIYHNIKTSKLIFASNAAVIAFAKNTDKLIIVQVPEWSNLCIYNDNIYEIISNA